MSLNELQVIAGFFERAVCPEDVFGELPGTTKHEIEVRLKHSFHKLAKAVHPDLHSGDPGAAWLAQRLFQELEQLRAEALARIKANTYGSRAPLPSKVPVIIKSKYVRNASFAAGDIADLHLASLESGKAKNSLLLKIARTAKDNDLLRSEANILAKIHSHKRFESSSLQSAVPTILDNFLLDDNGERRRANVMLKYAGFYDAQFIHKKLPIGVDGRTVAWMWKRMIVLLEWVHKIGVLHGAILPPHVLFYPDNDGNDKIDQRKHSLRLVDWCYAIEFENRTRLSAWVPKWQYFYAPEILEKRELSPATDMYMAAKTMLYLTGGDPVRNGFPDSIPSEMVSSISKCLHKNPDKRPQDSGKYFDEFNDAIHKAYGARRWHEFVVPGI